MPKKNPLSFGFSKRPREISDPKGPITEAQSQCYANAAVQRATVEATRQASLPPKRYVGRPKKLKALGALFTQGTATCVGWAPVGQEDVVDVKISTSTSISNSAQEDVVVLVLKVITVVVLVTCIAATLAASAALAEEGAADSPVIKIFFLLRKN